MRLHLALLSVAAFATTINTIIPMLGSVLGLPTTFDVGVILEVLLSDVYSIRVLQRVRFVATGMWECKNVDADIWFVSL